MTTSTRDAILAQRKDKQSMDVFETPETDDQSASAAPISTTQALLSAQASRPSTRKSEDVVQLDLKPSLAFARFAGRIYDAKPDTAAAQPVQTSSGPSLSAKIAPLPFARNDTLQPYAFASAASSASPFEAPVDKFNRLKREIAQFQSDLRAISSVTGPADDVGELAALLVRELGVLDGELSAVAADKKTSRLIGDAAEEDAPAGPLLTRMIARLQEAAAAGSGSSAAITIVTPPALVPSSDPGVNLQVLSSLDRRIAALERTVGLPVGLIATANKDQAVSAAGKRSGRTSLPPSSSNPSLSGSAAPGSASSSVVLNSYTSLFPDLYSGVMSLHRRLSLLDPQRLDAIHKNIKTINADMELLGGTTSTKDGAAAAADTAAGTGAPAGAGGGDGVVREGGRVHEMYEVLMRWDGWVGQLPLIVARLQGLKAVHDDTRGALERVRRMEAESEAMRRVLDEDRAALGRLGKALPDNVQQMDKNLQALQQRMSQLQQKIDAIKH